MLKNKCLLYLMLNFLYVTLLLAQNEPFRKHFVGRIDNKYNIVMNLNIDNDGHVTGNYFYKTQKKQIDLSGTVNGNDIQIKEIISGEINATFNGKLVNDVIEGSWISKNGKNLPFYIKEDYKGLLQYSIINDEKELIKKYKKNDCELTTELTFIYPTKMDENKKITQIRELFYEIYRESSFGSESDKSSQEAQEKYENTIEMNVIYNENNLLCLEINCWYICGTMPHGQPRTFYKIIDLKNIKVINIEDIFGEKYEEVLSERIKEYLEADSNYEYNDYFGFFVSKNIYITQNEINFYYNVYEIGTYASGPKTVTISFDEIPKKIISKNSILWKLIN